VEMESDQTHRITFACSMLRERSAGTRRGRKTAPLVRLSVSGKTMVSEKKKGRERREKRLEKRRKESESSERKKRPEESGRERLFVFFSFLSCLLVQDKEVCNEGSHPKGLKTRLWSRICR
jgi:hypothetical protein